MLREKIKKIVDDLHHWDAPEACFDNCEEKAVDAILAAFVEALPEEKSIHIPHEAGWNACLAEIKSRLGVKCA